MGDDSVDANGHLFIDRDPEIFEEVLRILRGYAFNSHPRLTWDEIKSEADFYLVPPELLADPAPEIALPPEMITIDTIRFRVERSKKSAHWIPLENAIPQDVQARMYTAGVHGRAVHPVALKELGFRQISDAFENYERKCRIIYYAKPKGVKLEIPGHANEIERHESSHWVCVSYAMFE